VDGRGCARCGGRPQPQQGDEDRNDVHSRAGGTGRLSRNSDAIRIRSPVRGVEAAGSEVRPPGRDAQESPAEAGGISRRARRLSPKRPNKEDFGDRCTAPHPIKALQIKVPKAKTVREGGTQSHGPRGWRKPGLHERIDGMGHDGLDPGIWRRTNPLIPGGIHASKLRRRVEDEKGLTLMSYSSSS